jgi:hypothetical protein
VLRFNVYYDIPWQNVDVELKARGITAMIQIETYACELGEFNHGAILSI